MSERLSIQDFTTEDSPEPVFNLKIDVLPSDWQGMMDEMERWASFKNRDDFVEYVSLAAYCTQLGKDPNVFREHVRESLHRVLLDFEFKDFLSLHALSLKMIGYVPDESLMPSITAQVEERIRTGTNYRVANSADYWALTGKVWLSKEELVEARVAWEKIEPADVQWDDLRDAAQLAVLGYKPQVTGKHWRAGREFLRNYRQMHQWTLFASTAGSMSLLSAESFQFTEEGLKVVHRLSGIAEDSSSSLPERRTF